MPPSLHRLRSKGWTSLLSRVLLPIELIPHFKTHSDNAVCKSVAATSLILYSLSCLCKHIFWHIDLTTFKIHMVFT